MSSFLPATAKSLSPEQQPLSPRGELLAQRRRRARLRFKVPNIRSSRNLSAAAARGYCGIEGAKDIQMKALLPNTHIGLTTSEKPTFFFHVSPTSIREAKFLLLDAEGKTILYKRIFALAKTGGVINFTLPADAKVLEVGQEYTWELAVLCDPDDQRGNPNVQGSIKRIEPSQKLANDLGKTPLYEHIALYANEGLWYDMLKTLADLRSCNPNDSTLVSDWKELLSSAGLSSINQEPLLQSCMSNQK
ncbi:MAG TPA: DUF928 domain-containing protein [Coleofasciculaceae cyanobacterium]